MAKMKAASPHCQQDCSPMVRINDRWECAAEYLDRCLEGKRVVDVVQLKGISQDVFDNGHMLPLLCFCCGEPLDTLDPKRVRTSILGRRLEGMSLAMVSMEDGRDLEQFRLEFSNKGIFSKGVFTPISPLAAADLHHPSGCPHRQDQEKARARLVPGHSSLRIGMREFIELSTADIGCTVLWKA